MSRQRDYGPFPEVELAIIESDMNHLREQYDNDRKSFGERMVELRAWRENVEKQLDELVGLSHKAHGAFWALGAIGGVGLLGTIVNLFLGVHR